MASQPRSSAVYGNVDVDAAVAARIRRQEILYDPGTPRQFEFVFTEAALYMPPCPREAMLGQLDRLMAMDLSHITIGIIPMGAELSMSPLNSFMLLDDLLVVESYGYEDRVGGDWPTRTPAFSNADDRIGHRCPRTEADHQSSGKPA